MSKETCDGMKAFSQNLPLVHAPNLSQGVCVTHELLNIATPSFSDAEMEITESHHRGKKDAPSGTALAFAQTIQEKQVNKGVIRFDSSRREKEDIVHSRASGRRRHRRAHGEIPFGWRDHRNYPSSDFSLRIW